MWEVVGGDYEQQNVVFPQDRLKGKSSWSWLPLRKTYDHIVLVLARVIVNIIII